MKDGFKKEKPKNYKGKYGDAGNLIELFDFKTMYRKKGEQRQKMSPERSEFVCVDISFRNKQNPGQVFVRHSLPGVFVGSFTCEMIVIALWCLRESVESSENKINMICIVFVIYLRLD